MAANVVNIDNQYSEALDIYTFTVPSGASADSPSTMYPVYTKVDSVAANSKKTYTPSNPLENLSFARQSDGMPLLNQVTNILGDTNVTITADDLTSAQKAFAFYQAYKGSPYSPNALAVNDIILNNSDLTQQNQKLNQWFSDNNVGFDYNTFSSVSYWAENDVRAWAGSEGLTLYCYNPQPPQPMIPLVLPKDSSGQIILGADGSALYQPTSGSTVELTLSKGTLTSNGATDTSGVNLSAVMQDMIMHGGDAGVYELFFTGKVDGDDVIVQPYQVPQLAWWMSAYDLAYTAYTAINIIMISQTVIALAKNLPTLFNALKTGGQAVISAVKSDLSNVAQWISSKFTSAAADNGDLVNVDVDTDVDVDVDVDVDTDVDTDVDVDVDIDVDIDIDIDALVVVDVDVDIDVDIDTDVDTVVDNVVDNVTDIDTDIDTDINVDSSALGSLVKNIGQSLWANKGAIFKFVLKNAAVMGGMTAAQKLLGMWGKKAGDSYADEQPSEAAPLGLLMDYMENPANTIQERWTTFSYYVDQGASADEQNMAVSGILSLKNDAEDQAFSAWRWSQDDENAAVNAMAQYSSQSDWPKAYTTLASYTYQGKTLPLKVGASVALKFVAKIL
ncbi:hypothetical protein [Hahella sp. HN01]|uniref:hypothetical protein n=1 Tax=Hahella sp. HN01 TaxID=2847262 RepID=UPI001C1EB6B5|nr:hypothetical protein [Hahella sp. HN01]MBU6953463.1 hypothetical protein [Hahella sp. HN01]